MPSVQIDTPPPPRNAAREQVGREIGLYIITIRAPFLWAFLPHHLHRLPLYYRPRKPQHRIKTPTRSLRPPPILVQHATSKPRNPHIHTTLSNLLRASPAGDQAQPERERDGEKLLKKSSKIERRNSRPRSKAGNQDGGVRRSPFKGLKRLENGGRDAENGVKEWRYDVQGLPR